MWVQKDFEFMALAKQFLVPVALPNRKESRMIRKEYSCLRLVKEIIMSPKGINKRRLLNVWTLVTCPCARPGRKVERGQVLAHSYVLSEYVRYDLSNITYIKITVCRDKRSDKIYDCLVKTLIRGKMFMKVMVIGIW